MAIAGLLLVAPSLTSDLIALAFVAPVLMQQLVAKRAVGAAELAN